MVKIVVFNISEIFSPTSKEVGLEDNGVTQ